MNLHVSPSIPSPVPRIASLSREEERTLITRARAGGDPQVRQDIVLSLQPRLSRLATRLARYSTFLERDDLVSWANIAILEKFEVALWKNNPYAYLYRVAQKTMIACLNGRYDFVKRHSEQKRVPVQSLDIPVEDDGSTLADILPQEGHISRDTACLRQREHLYAALHHAVEALPEKQRFVIQHSYGLGEHAPERINEISRQLRQTGTSSHPSNAHYHSKHALHTLHRVLSPLFPQYTASPTCVAVTAHTGE